MNERAHAILTIVGRDRPGIVHAFSEWILNEGGNIEESRMTQLGGDFAAIVLVSGSADTIAKLEGTCSGFETAQNMTVLCRTVAGMPVSPQEPVLRYCLSATSLDHAGIVHRVTRLLSGRGINIVSAETETKAAPFTGTPVFQFQAEVDIPASVSINGLRAELKELGEAQSIDVSLEPM